MRITWIIGGLSVRGVGMSIAGNTIDVPTHIGKDLIEQGIARKPGRSLRDQTTEADLERSMETSTAIEKED